MADISAIPQNQLLGRLAGFLRFLEKDRPEFLPSQLGAMQAASKLMLPQASTVENLSYGNLPFTMPPSGTGAMIPQVKTGRKAEVADLVGMITGGVPGAKTVADVGTNLSNKAADELVRMITRNPQATAPAVLQEAGQMAPLARMFKPEQAAKVLPQTKILDEAGNPQLMYHGTTKEFKNFKKNVTPDDHVPGISVTDEPWMASGYAKQVEGSNVRPVYVDAKNPINYEDLEAWALEKAKQKGMKIKDEEDFAAFDIPQNKLVKWLKEDGYDAIDYRSDPMLGYGLRVFEPKQIKSAISDPVFSGLLD